MGQESRFVRLVSATLIVCLLSMVVPIGPAQGALIGTGAIAAQANGSGERDRIAAFLGRTEVQALLEANGVDSQQAMARAQRLSDREASMLAQRIDELPAGGSSIIGVLFAVFIILLITDILGLTKVFPFTRPVR